jgi:predicted RNA-binding protein YlqC (UPF0109 family)
MTEQSENVRQWLYLALRAQVNHPEFVDVSEGLLAGGGSMFIARVSVTDMGLVLGKNGRLIRALRTLVYAQGQRDKTRYELGVAGIEEKPKTGKRTIYAIEKSFAYERAMGSIEFWCEKRSVPGWIDIDAAETDLYEELTYLEWRRLLVHHDEHPNLIKFCDEGEPVAASGSAEPKFGEKTGDLTQDGDLTWTALEKLPVAGAGEQG